MANKHFNPDMQHRMQKDTQDIPGPLRSEAILTIQTRAAQKLVAGRKMQIADPFNHQKKVVEHIMGVYSFGRRMNAIWIAAQYDDPYADWFLLQVESALETAKSTITEKTKELSQILESVDAIKIQTSHSIKPVVIKLSFANPYGYMGAYLVAEFDALSCAVLTAWHIGLVDRVPKRDIMVTASKMVRRAFLLSTRWHFTGATRSAILAGEPIAAEAQTKMGELPQEILDITHRAKFAPDIRSVLDFVLPTSTENPSMGIAVPDAAIIGLDCHTSVHGLGFGRSDTSPSG
jgi:integrating conjugative element protein (TIGR03761 family)